MTGSAAALGPGARLLAEQLPLPDDADLYAELHRRHPAGDRAYRLARALTQAATELDGAFREAQDAGHLLRTHRSQPTPARAPAASHNPALENAAHKLEMALLRCDVLDTALIRLLAVYLDLAAGASTPPTSS